MNSSQVTLIERAVVRGVAVFALYALFATAPVLVLLLGPTPAGREFLREFSVALAFGGAAIFILQFALAARFRRLKAPFGIDAVYHFHREVAYVGLILVATHPILLFVLDPGLLVLLNPLTAPWRAKFALVALVSVALTVLLSTFRDRLATRYEVWRGWHGVLAVVAVAAAIAHIEGVGYYVSTPASRLFWVAYPLGWLCVLAWTRLVRPALKARSPWRVVRVRPELGDSVTLALEPVGGGRLDFSGGQFAWLTLGKTPYSLEEHPFSLSGSATSAATVEMTIKRLGDWTSDVGEIEVGTVGYLDGPYGSFTIERYPADRYLFVAGGVGITPFVSILRTCAQKADRRSFTLVYGVQSMQDATLRDDLEALTAHLDLQLVFVPMSPDPDWEGPSGYITPELLDELLPPRGAERGEVECFICGPPPMMRAVEGHLHELGVSAWRIHYERFDLV